MMNFDTFYLAELYSIENTQPLAYRQPQVLAMLLFSTTMATSLSGVMSRTEIERNDVGTQQLCQLRL